MMLDHWKPLGGFIENTIRPVLEESKWILQELQKQGLNVTEDNIFKAMDRIAKIHLRTVILESVRAVVIAGIIGYCFLKCKT